MRASGLEQEEMDRCKPGHAAAMGTRTASGPCSLLVSIGVATSIYSEWYLCFPVEKYAFTLQIIGTVS